ncbi:MAG: hypothetical protein QM790_00680 [Nibricoccus sp.]
MTPLAKTCLLLAVAPALNAALASSAVSSVSASADISHFDIPKATRSPLSAPFIPTAVVSDSLAAQPVVFEAAPRNKTDFKIASAAPDKKRDYKMLVVEPNPNVDPEFLINPPTRRSSR